MSPHPDLTVDRPSGAEQDPDGEPVRGLALVLHGGRERSQAPVRPGNLAVLRMAPFATALRRAGGADGLAVARLRHRVRGWNGPNRSPVGDARWALAELDRRYPGVPVVLLGHSMGGRTAIYVADYPTVRGVIGLAPWIEPEDSVAPLAGRRVLLAHGTHDRMTSARASARFAEQAAAVAASISFVSVTGERHAMLRRRELWHELAAGFAIGVLFGRSPGGTVDGATTNVLAKALAGQPSLVV